MVQISAGVFWPMAGSTAKMPRIGPYAPVCASAVVMVYNSAKEHGGLGATGLRGGAAAAAVAPARGGGGGGMAPGAARWCNVHVVFGQYF